MATPNEATFELEVRRTYRATPAKVYQAWTKAEAVARWFAPSNEYRVVVHELDVKVGGRYRIEMAHQSGRSSIALGTYRELEPGKRIAFTWKWESRPTMPETVVEIDLLPQGNDTELVLTHRLFDEGADRDNHEKGWCGCLDQLPNALA